MRWATNQMIHFDRVASAWLIKRFIDPNAHFDFLGPGDAPPEGAIPFSMEGAELGRHDRAGTTFSKLMRRYSLDDPGLEDLERIVAAGVAHVTAGQQASPEDRATQIAFGVVAVTEGLLVTSASDKAMLARSMPIWDALYAEAGLCRLRREPPAADNEARRNTRFIMAVARALRVNRSVGRIPD